MRVLVLGAVVSGQSSAHPSSSGALAMESLSGPQSDQAKPKTKIAGIYFFGYQADGLDVTKIRDALPIHAGQELSPEEKIGPGIKAVVEKLTGHPPTDIARVCCDEKGGLWIYVGLQGKSYKAKAYTPAPQGAMRLPEVAMKLEKDWEHAFEAAAQKGDFNEDDSQGYALAHDPEERAQDLAIRTYTLKNEELVYQVLSGSADVEHRRTAAQFLGYATQSQRQIDALTQASHDVDEGVRNNATRALSVLAESSDKLARMIPAADFVDMLNSGTWMDRNKGSAVLLSLSKFRDPKLLAQLRERALPGLIEIARWDFGHAMTRVILGRMAGIEEASLDKMVGDDNQMEEIIASVQKSQE